MDVSMMAVFAPLVLLMFLQGMVHGRPEHKYDGSKATQPCDRPDAYCDGESFDFKIAIKNRLVTCDVVPDPTEGCCMPQAKHKVCYDILVDGNRLNFQPSSPTDDTNFSSLCEALLKSIGMEPGKYATAYTEDGNGTLRYNFNSFDVANDRGKFIKHLACSVKE